MDFRLPELGEGVYEAELVSWLVQVGQTVKRGQSLMEVLTDKATMEVPSPFAGAIASLMAEPGHKLKVGQVVLSYEQAGQPMKVPDKSDGEVRAKVPAAKAAVAVGRENGPSARSSTGTSLIKAAPSVRYLARKLGLDLSGIGGTGPEGRILLGDLSAVVQTSAALAKPTRQEPAFEYGKPGTRLKLVGLRRKIAEHMVHARQTIPHYSYVDECDVTDLVKMRESLKDAFGQAGLKLTYLAFFVKAIVGALKEVPLVNASLDDAAGEIILHDRYHIGIAVNTPAGLMVPVVKDADKKDLSQIAREVEHLSNAARTGKTKLDDLRGGTFTITSIGNIGGLISTPIIHHPEVGILGIGKIVKRPIFDDHGNIKPADMLYLSFSFDHRVLDGAIGAAFGNALVRRLKNPATLLLPEKL